MAPAAGLSVRPSCRQQQSHPAPRRGSNRPPVAYTAKRYKETGDASIIWEGHKAGREIGYCHMEKLSNLDALPDHGFKVACFPVKIEKASAGWTRAVAIIED